MAAIDIARLASDADLALVDQVREVVRDMAFEPLDNRALAGVFERSEFSVADAETEGVIRSPLVAAFHRMLIEERAPEPIRDKAAAVFSVLLARREHRRVLGVSESIGGENTRWV